MWVFSGIGKHQQARRWEFCSKIYFNRVASRPGISWNWEFCGTWKKSGNFVVLEKSQRILWNLEKSGSFTCAKQILPKFFQDSFMWWTWISHACSYITHVHGFLLKKKKKMSLNCGIVFFILFGSENVLLLI